MRINWNFGLSKSHGISYGYWVLGKALRRALLGCDVIFNKDAETVFSLCAPNAFSPIFSPPKKNALMSMWEADAVPSIFAGKLRYADIVIVPCQHNKKAFEKSIKNKARVEVCQLGYDDTEIKYQHRERKDDNFKFLWVGAPNIRKGFDIVIKAFQAAFKTYEPVELRLKTTALWEDEIKTNLFAEIIGYMPPKGEWRIMPKVILDNRNLPREELIKLYHDAHAFVFPSRGEGFGLPALEAMAAGCLVIAPSIQGLAEFVNPDTAWVIPCGKIRAYYPDPIWAPEPDWKELARLMRKAYERYADTAALREEAGAFVRDNFTWTHCAKRLKTILAEV